MSNNWEQNEEIQIFRDYLRIPSIQPDNGYEPCVAFIIKQAESLGLPYKVYRPGGPDQPIVVITWEGTNSELPSILLNSHMDVVAVFPENWTHPPFAAEMDSEGRIFARGAQDMKCIGMQHLATIRALKNAGVKLKRTIHITFVPDEESGGKLGMDKFVHTEDFKNLNIGFSLDEGVASEDEVFSIFYAERFMWRLHLKISGTTGHGSLLHENTAGCKLNYVLGKLMARRQKEVDRLKNNSNLTIGDVMTINLTKINGGVQSNVVPSLIVAVFDIRIPLNVDDEEFLTMIKTWCEEAGGGIEVYLDLREPKVESTKIDSSNIFWTAFKSAFDELGLKTRELVFPGGTDSRYIRNIGIPALGFSPMNLTTITLHANDEYLKAETYLKGIEIYKKIVQKLANA
ncbi:aminoacylase-1B-like [Episyrphus balteatus]|uniref:aminoacylase-1B-like n=1 Tax=Episyrphus balteatus TaxID=286459 RepID=UPI002486194F|nr:aminoacylase-1B-like [Episyrphus balteatus]